MALLKIHTDRIIDNIEKINAFMTSHDKQWSLVVKVLGNDKATLSAILNHSCIDQIHSIAVSQVNNLRLVKGIHPGIRTLYIKPPAIKNASLVVKYADISINSSGLVIQALNEAAKKQDKRHRIIIMIEMGELREGIKREGLISFYKNVFKLSNIEVVGLGTNLGCMFGIQPTYDKLIQLVLYQQLLEAKFKRKLPIVSGASSITLPLLHKNKMPEGVNHFRIGEAAFLGTSPLNDQQFLDLNTGAFTFEANIVELYRKASQPDGEISQAAVGHAEIPAEENDAGVENYRAVVDFGILDVDADYLIPEDPSVIFSGNSSDMTVYDLGDNPSNYETGDVLRFRLKYLAAAKLMYSNYVEKKLV
ncbi:MAG: alanine racemase [Candidatus Cloacimonadaceae bacterium]|nr:alanine racemase [Candidatus Cloacimonadaceae bacterium]